MLINNFQIFSFTPNRFSHDVKCHKKRVEYGECKLTQPPLSFTKHYSQRLFNIHILILHNRFPMLVCTRNFGRIFVLKFRPFRWRRPERVEDWKRRSHEVKTKAWKSRRKIIFGLSSKEKKGDMSGDEKFIDVLWVQTLFYVRKSSRNSNYYLIPVLPWRATAVRMLELWK